MKKFTLPLHGRIAPRGRVPSWPALALVVLLSAQVIGGIAWLVLDRGTPFWDEAVFLSNASGYCAGSNATSPLDYLRTSTFYPPAVAWSSCPFYALSGGSIDAVRVTGLLFLLGTVVGTYALGVVATDRKWLGVMAAFLVGTYPIVFGEARFLLADVPTMFWSTVVLILLANRRAMEPVRWGALLGAALGVGLLTFWRFPIYVGVPVLVVLVQILVEAYRDRQQKQWLKAAGLCAVVAVLIAGPWYGSVIVTLIGDLGDSLGAAGGEGDPNVATWQSLVWYPLSFINDQVGIVAASVSLIVMAGVLKSSRVRVRHMISPAWWTTGLRLSALSLASGIVILFFLFNKDPRFPMPLLVPVAVITAAGLGEAVRRGSRIRRYGYALIAASILNGLFLFFNVSFIGFPESPIFVQLGDQHISFASPRYHQARSPAGSSVCDFQGVIEFLEQIDGRERRVGILSDGNYWNYFSFPYWPDWEVHGLDLVSLSQEERPSSFDVLVLGGTWERGLSPPGFRLAGSCTAHDGSKVSLHIPTVDEEALSSFEERYVGTWTGSNAELTRDGQTVVSSSTAGAGVWAEASYIFADPADLTSAPGIHIEWRLSDSSVRKFWVFLEDVAGNKMVWDRTSAVQAERWSEGSALRWADARKPEGFKLEAVSRLVLSIQEPDPPVKAIVVVRSDRIVLQ